MSYMMVNHYEKIRQFLVWNNSHIINIGGYMVL